MKGLEEIIAEHPFFEGLEPGYLTLVAGCAQMAAYRAGEYLMTYGAEAEHFFLLRHGRVALELSAPARDTFRFQTVDAGEVVGWSWLIPPHKSQFDARAVENTSVIKFGGKCLRGKCDADPKLGYDLMKRFTRVMVQRFADTRLQLIDVYGKQGR